MGPHWMLVIPWFIFAKQRTNMISLEFTEPDVSMMRGIFFSRANLKTFSSLLVTPSGLICTRKDEPFEYSLRRCYLEQNIKLRTKKQKGAKSLFLLARRAHIAMPRNKLDGRKSEAIFGSRKVLRKIVSLCLDTMKNENEKKKKVRRKRGIMLKDFSPHFSTKSEENFEEVHSSII